MNEAFEAFNQFWEATEVFSIRNVKLLWKYLFLFSEGCLIALKMYLPVILSGGIVGYIFGKISYKSETFKYIVEGPGQMLASLCVVALMPLHFFITALFQVKINPFITIPIAFSIMNIVMISRGVSDNLADYYSRKMDIRPDGTSILVRRLVGGILISQSVIFNIILFLTLVIATDIFDTKSSIALIPTKYKNKEIFGAFMLFFGLTAYFIHYLSIILKKLIFDPIEMKLEDNERI